VSPTNGYAAQLLSLPVTAVVPVKLLGLAKSRLALPHHERRELVLAFAVDTVVALTGCAEVGAVIVVTADPDIAHAAARLGARVVPDPDTTSLDEAIAVGVQAAIQARPEAGVLVVPADLPCLRPEDVTEVLRQSRGFPTSFVPDRAGTGTTMVACEQGEAVVTRYGRESAARHTELGLQALRAAPVRARHDVDTLEDLRHAITLGLGASTAALVGDGASRTPRRPLPTR
jgi:2-phospho-L-lactate guanylyltransferase